MASQKGKKQDGRKSDLTFSWMLTTLGPEWKQWQLFAAEWMSKQNKAVSPKQQALARFFESYLLMCAPYATEIALFFNGYNNHRCSTDEFKTVLSRTVKSNSHLSMLINCSCEFIEYIIENHFSEPDDHGIPQPLVGNPLRKVRKEASLTETVRNPLPYRYIQDLRQILCPLPNKAELATIKQQLKAGDSLLPAYHYRHFKNWMWAQQQSGGNERGGSGDWFEVVPDLIDRNDPDCVWRNKRLTRNGKKITIFQLWSPVRSMAIYVKLLLPLRTYQVRMLDSGEADTWIYHQGQWQLNDKHNFSMGSDRRPFGKGVFKRIYDSMTGVYSTGLYINTNKTVDQNKEEIQRGYTIPWQHDEALYWLEKLRNWQEKYNPIEKPTSCTTLLAKHTRDLKSSEQLEQMGEICFLFRDAAASNNDDKVKPISDTPLFPFWYQLLLTLENRLTTQGNTLNNGDRLKLVVDYPVGVQMASKTATLFPLHSLRVSLITAYAMDTQLPLPVISKLLAGHSRILMTIYYTKITPSVMARKMNEAHAQLDASSEQSVRDFLNDASMSQIQGKMVYKDAASIEAVLDKRIPIGWEDRATGLCLVGGNTANTDHVSTLGGCWNGGDIIKESVNASFRVYSPVSHGAENCIRCRWFITEARYLPALHAKINQLSYFTHQAANLSIEIEGELEALKDEQFNCEVNGLPFTKHKELQVLQRRYEKQQVEADEYAKDWIACFELIHKIVRIEEVRGDNKNDKIIAVGSEQDVSYALKFIETDSELLHLSLLCDDAEFYPDLQDTLRKTPVIEKRTRQLNRVFMRKDLAPIFMEMDEKQQLIAANAMLRHMAKIADPDDKMEGYRKVADYLEMAEYLQDNKLLDAGITALTDKALPFITIKQPAFSER
ncbi:gamma-mobile-trio integrase GmtZ [Aeromonas allosaccharophila]|uniref:gamma-mobile-trio integrase GmtZ n=1 Tax=Aeromonas allosaccharophila TaxID=656 RepID=UPI000DD03E81|nr:integrase family protein [Aeromonas allosaccharophila]